MNRKIKIEKAEWQLMQHLIHTLTNAPVTFASYLLLETMVVLDWRLARPIHWILFKDRTIAMKPYVALALHRILKQTQAVDDPLTLIIGRQLYQKLSHFLGAGNPDPYRVTNDKPLNP